MPAGDLSIQVPVADSPLHASSVHEAERAEPDFLPRPNEASLNSTLPSRTYGNRSSLKNSSEDDPSQSFPRRVCICVARYLLFPFKKIYLTYRLHKGLRKERKERKEAHLQALYANVKVSKETCIEDYPKGWPQLAAFIHSHDNFGVYRKFGLAHCRVLLHLQADIELLTQKLADLDHVDSITGAKNAWRLKTAEFKFGWDPAQRDLLKQLQEQLLVYDRLLFYDQSLRDMNQPSEGDYRSVLHWIMAKKPLGGGQYDWISPADDFVQLSKVDRFQSSVLSSFLKALFRIDGPRDGAGGQIVHQYSASSISAIEKLLNVLLAVGILITPVFLLLWIPMARSWISATVLMSVLAFSMFMSLLTKAKIQEVLVGTAAYCAVLASFLSNTQDNMSTKSA